MIVASSAPLIVDVKRGSTEDGPGLRTTVFFKGCPLRCTWCHNPETWSAELEIGFFEQRCIGCRSCGEACGHGAIDDGAAVRIRQDRCQRCGECTRRCPSTALRAVGREWTVDRLTDVLLRDQPFYETSGGGVTLSGGEPTLWPAYAGDLLRGLKSHGIHTVLQTCGHFEFEAFAEQMLPWTDLVLYDLKFSDARAHRRFTGQSNRTILRNFTDLVRTGRTIVPRVPLVPGITMTRQNLTALASFLRDHRMTNCVLLPHNPLSRGKHRALGKAEPTTTDNTDDLEMEECREIFRVERSCGNPAADSPLRPGLRSLERNKG